MDESVQNKISYKPVVIRSRVETRNNYLDYKDDLRFDFYYSCAYCSITEIEACGIGFQIDHYLPLVFFPDKETDYNNLMWSCQQCNGRKSEFFPAEDHNKRGLVVIRPDEDDPREHLRASGIYVEHKTETGKFNIALLDLNRQTLLRAREIRQRMWNSRNFIAHGVLEMLQMGIDRIPQTQRVKFLRIRKQLIGEYETIQQTTEEFIRGIARSPLLDADPEKFNRLKDRRKYLKEIMAISPDYRISGVSHLPN